MTLATDLISLGLFHRRLIMWKTRSDWNTQRMTLAILKVRSHVGWHRGSVERFHTDEHVLMHLLLFTNFSLGRHLNFNNLCHCKIFLLFVDLCLHLFNISLVFTCCLYTCALAHVHTCLYTCALVLVLRYGTCTLKRITCARDGGLLL